MEPTTIVSLQGWHELVQMQKGVLEKNTHTPEDQHPLQLPAQ